MRFKEFLNEYVAPNKSKEWNLMIQGALPLKNTVLPSEYESVTAYHVTDSEMFEQLVKLQNKKVQLPTFTKGATWVAQGIYTSGEVLVELEGLSKMTGSTDMMTTLDRNGQRWLTYDGTNSKALWNKFQKLMQQKVLDYFRSLLKPILDKDPKFLPEKYGRDTQPLLFSLANAMDGKEKAAFIKWYYDEAKKMITPELLKKINSTMKIAKRGTESSKINEVILEKFQIKKFWYIDSENYNKCKREDCLKKYKSKYEFCGIITDKEIGKITPKNPPKCKY